MGTGQRRQRTLHRLFAIGVAIKGIDGLLEIGGGLLLLFLSRQAIGHAVRSLTQHELSEDPGDMIANFARSAVSRLSTGTKLLGGIYLLGHGFIKIFLAVELLRDRMWSFPAAICFLCAFIGYEAYRLSIHYSTGLFLLICFDVVVVALIWWEYKSLQQKRE